MAQAADEKLLRRFRILVAPLDWGLGHATRCIPIIRELLSNNCDVWLAGEGIQEALLRLEFPDLPFLSLAGYRIEYSKSKMGLPGKMILQIPKIISAIRKEHRWLKRMVAAHDFDVVISDNRFGLYHSKIPTVFITHQLSIKNESWKWTEKVLRRWNYNYINRFCECWVPDAPGKLNLAGELSHPAVKPNLPVKYIGLLSRFEKNVASSPFIRNKDKDHLLLILSGPEPQRSILEDKIIDEISHYNGTATVVRGLPASLSIVPSTGMIRFYNHLSAKELNEEMEKADWVIGRCGYSTVMDLVKLQKKSILVPTPGQTEQEYLAKYLEQKRIAMYVDQSNFSIGAILSNANSFDYQIPDLHSSDHLKQAVRDFLRRRE
jgi:predicted glycosyltransferase